MLLEVIVQSVADAVAAADGGADRLEVVRDVARGGLTPDAELVAAIADEVDLPLRVMARENDGYDLRPGELSALVSAIDAFLELGVDGIVLGFARAGEPAVDEVRRVLASCGAARLTFHRAFDQLDDQLSALVHLQGIPQIDRVLTSGGAGSAAERCEWLRRLRERAGRIAIIAGGGVDAAMLDAIARSGCVNEVHVGRAARGGDDPEGPVSAASVRKVAARLRRARDHR